MRFIAETLFDTDSPGEPIETFATFEFEPDISFAIPTAVFGITPDPELICARKETEPFTGEVIYPLFTTHVMFCPTLVPPL